MRLKRFMMPLLAVVCALTVCSCKTRPDGYLADDTRRAQVVDILLSDPAMRQEVIDRLIGPPTNRAALLERIGEDEEVSSQLIQLLLAKDRGKAIVADRVAADGEVAKQFIRMLMLTGAMGESMTQAQAERLGLGKVFAYGNQRRTMVDVMRIGSVIDQWAIEHQGRYPICDDFSDVASCLAKEVPAGVLKDVRLKDAWGRPLLYRATRDGRQYILVSYATDGLYDDLGKVGPTDSFDCDIVFSNGDFLQWPGVIKKERIR